MNLSFKPKQPTPMETVLSLARAIVVGGPWTLVPEEKWHAMHERHEADALALRSALARVVEVEATVARLTSIVDDWHTVVKAVGRDPGTEHETGRALDDILDAARILQGYAPDLSIDEAAARLTAELATARGQP